jgi:hypothetical protein
MLKTKGMNYNYETVKQIADRHGLIEVCFDTECIYNEGDLTKLLEYVTCKIFPGHFIQISENTSADGLRYVARMSKGERTLELTTDTTSDWLSDVFFEQLEKIPEVFGDGKILYMVNPAVGLTGQEVMFFYGPVESLKQARIEGLPLIFPGEDITETIEFKRAMGG